MTNLRPRQVASSTSSPISVPAAKRAKLDAIYLDYAATTPVDPAVARTMNAFLLADGIFGNPASATHAFGHAAAQAVEHARGEVAFLLSSQPEEIIWTSGATEAINLALKGAALARRNRGDHIITSTLEHRAVLDSTAWLETQGFTTSYIEPDETGTITADALLKALRPNTILVSLMYVNNETGTVTDIASLAPLVHKHGALLHVDAVQGVARLPTDPITTADMVSISAHKMYGPKGVGALCIRRPLHTELVPQIHGGGHEFGLRSGTLPTHQIAGMGHAAKLVTEYGEGDSKHVRALDHQLCAHLKRIKGAEINGNPHDRVPGIVNISFVGVEAEALMVALGGVAISSGSACTSANIEPSHVLLALGYDSDRTLSSVRFSFGRFTTANEITRAGQLVNETVTALRRIAR